MANERKWFAVTQAFTANGTLQGKITVADVAGLYVKSKVRISSNTQPPQLLEIKRIEGTTVLFVGLCGDNINDRTDMSAYLVIDSAKVELFEQKIPTIKQEDIAQAVYAREPICAIRTIGVDKYGRYYDANNRFPVDATVTIGDVLVNVENPTIPDIANVSVPLAATEVSFTFPLKTKRFLMRIRDGSANIQLAFIAGQSGTNYTTISRGCNYGSGDIDPPDPFSIYFQCDKPGKTVEILSWNN